MKIQATKPAKLLAGTKRHVQGIRSDIGDLKLRGTEIRAHLKDTVVLGASLSRTIEGASTVKVVVHDPEGKLRRSDLVLEQFDVELDGLWFRFAGMGRQDRDSLELTLQARNVARLRIAPGALKGKRGTYTRAEFWASQAVSKDVKGKPIPIWVPELHDTQPIATDKAAKQAKAETDVTRGKAVDEKANTADGIDPSAKLTVKGTPANSEQIKIADTILRVGTSLNAPVEALIASIMVGIAESLLTNNPNMLDATSTGVFQVQTATAQGAGIDPMDVAACAEAWFTKGFYQQSGIGGAKAGLSLQMIAQSAQGSAFSDGSNYAPYQDEARAYVDAFGGGTLGASTGTTTTTTVTTTKEYSFERKADETIWANGLRLFEEVNWRFFEAAGVIYVITEPELLGSKIRAHISDNSPGIESVTYEYLVGKEQDQITVSCRAKEWAAPPGSVAAVHGQGPVDGRYLVSSIESNLLSPSELCTITLKRPQKPLPEPAPETSTSTKTTMSGGGGGTSTASVGGSSIGARLISWAESEVGVTEGSSQQVEYASALGFSASLPWCSIFVGYGLKFKCGIDDLPANPAYSGDWIGWSGGSEVSESSMEPGDIVVFDWGDGGMTDHVAIFAGNGQVVGGNQSNAVTKTSLTTSAIVGCVRVDG